MAFLYSTRLGGINFGKLVLFSDWSLLLRLRPPCAGEISKTSFHSENASDVVRPHYAGEIWKRINQRGFWIVFEEILGREIWLSWCPVFEMLRIWSVCYPQKRKAADLKFLRFEECFRKAPFSWRVNVGGRSNRRNKAAFLNFFHVVWTGL